MPILGLGTWKSEPGEVYDAIRTAIKVGYRHFDCAAIYGNEAEIGQAFSDAMKAGDVERESLWVTSKLWNNAHLKADVEPALRQTLSDLQLDYLDLYLVHWPVAHKPEAQFPRDGSAFLNNEEAPITETWEAMQACQQKGLAQHIGVSNFNIQKLKEAQSVGGQQPEMNQVELHPLLAQNDLVEFCKDNGVHLTAYSPLGSRDRHPAMKAAEEPDLFQNPTLNRVADEHGVHPAQILIKWAEDRNKFD